MEKFNLGSNENACVGLWFAYITPSGEGNGNTLLYSCLENPRDRGAWWAAVYGVAQSQTRLKRLSSSSSIYEKLKNLLSSFKNENCHYVPVSFHEMSPLSPKSVKHCL